MYIVSLTGLGKTYTLLKILEKELFQEFTYIFLICPTFKDNDTYQEWIYKDDPKFFVLKVSQDNVEHCLQIISRNYKNTNSLIILDDCASCQFVKNRTSSLVEFAFHGRHAGFSTVVISQHFKAITLAFRDNCQIVLVFYTLNESDWDVVSKSFLPRLTKEKRNEIYDALEQKKYSYFHIARGVKRLVLPNKNVILFNN